MRFDNHDRPLPPHVYTEEEREKFETMAALLKNGWKITRANNWKNHPKKGGYFETVIQKGDQKHIFELKMPTPMIFGPSDLEVR